MGIFEQNCSWGKALDIANILRFIENRVGTYGLDAIQLPGFTNKTEGVSHYVCDEFRFAIIYTEQCCSNNDSIATCLGDDCDL